MRIIISLFLFSVFFLVGCTEKVVIKQPRITQIIKKDAPIVVNFKVVAGKTKRQDVLDQLGSPDSRGTLMYSYEFNDENNKVCKLELDTLNKEHFNIELGSKKEDYKYQNLLITFEINQSTGNVGNTVWDVSFY